MAASESSRQMRKRKFASLIDDKEKEQKSVLRVIYGCLKKPRNAWTESERKLVNKYPDQLSRAQRQVERNARRRSRAVEVEDPPETIADKCRRLTEIVRSSRHLVVYSGAGVSTAASIPDYRGPDGIWTRLSQGRQIGQHDLTAASPTYTHMALEALWRRSTVKHVVSQNCDGLHLRSGIGRRALSEVHGNMYIEVCVSCPRQYVRNFDVTTNTSRANHKTGRRCYECGTPLVDTVVHFGERGRLKWPLNWSAAVRHARRADTILCLGSSLKVLRKYQWLWCMHRPPERRPQLCIVNLQWTPKDHCAFLKINARCDDVMQQLMKFLNVEAPVYSIHSDPLLRMVTPLHRSEESPPTCLVAPSAVSPAGQSKDCSPQAPPILPDKTPPTCLVAPSAVSPAGQSNDCSPQAPPILPDKTPPTCLVAPPSVSHAAQANDCSLQASPALSDEAPPSVLPTDQSNYCSLQAPPTFLDVDSRSSSKNEMSCDALSNRNIRKNSDLESVDESKVSGLKQEVVSDDSLQSRLSDISTNNQFHLKHQISNILHYEASDSSLKLNVSKLGTSLCHEDNFESNDKKSKDIPEKCTISRSDNSLLSSCPVLAVPEYCSPLKHKDVSGCNGVIHPEVEPDTSQCSIASKRSMETCDTLSDSYRREISVSTTTTSASTRKKQSAADTDTALTSCDNSARPENSISTISASAEQAAIVSSDICASVHSTNASDSASENGVGFVECVGELAADKLHYTRGEISLTDHCQSSGCDRVCSVSDGKIDCRTTGSLPVTRRTNENISPATSPDHSTATNSTTTAIETENGTLPLDSCNSAAYSAPSSMSAGLTISCISTNGGSIHDSTLPVIAAALKSTTVALSANVCCVESRSQVARSLCHSEASTFPTSLPVISAPSIVSDYVPTTPVSVSSSSVDSDSMSLAAPSEVSRDRASNVVSTPPEIYNSIEAKCQSDRTVILPSSSQCNFTKKSPIKTANARRRSMVDSGFHDLDRNHDANSLLEFNIKIGRHGEYGTEDELQQVDGDQAASSEECKTEGGSSDGVPIVGGSTDGVPTDGGQVPLLLKHVHVQTDPINWEEEHFTVLSPSGINSVASPQDISAHNCHDNDSGGCEQDAPDECCQRQNGVAIDGLIKSSKDLRIPGVSLPLNKDCIEKLNCSDVIFLDLTSSPSNRLDSIDNDMNEVENGVNASDESTNVSSLEEHATSALWNEQLISGGDAECEQSDSAHLDCDWSPLSPPTDHSSNERRRTRQCARSVSYYEPPASESSSCGSSDASSACSEAGPINSVHRKLFRRRSSGILIHRSSLSSNGGCDSGDSDVTSSSDSGTDAEDEYRTHRAVFRVSRRFLRPVLVATVSASNPSTETATVRSSEGAGWYGKGYKAARRSKRRR